MAVKKLKQFKEKKKLEDAKQQYFDRMVEEKVKDRFFAKNVPKWILWLITHSKTARDHFNYQIGVVDNNITKLILYREIKGKTKVIAKSF